MLNTPVLTVKSLSDLYDEPPTNEEWLVDGLLISGGLSLLAGKPKAGKTTLIRHLAVCVAKGHDFLGRPLKQGGVLYLALEEKSSQILAHFKSLGAEKGLPIDVSAPGPKKPGKEKTGTLDEFVRTLRPALVIIDPLFRYIQVKDGNDYHETTRALDSLLQLARETGTHIACVHHLGKSERGGTDAILGSTAIYGAVDAALVLDRRGDSRFLSSVQRYGENLNESELVLDPVTRTPVLVGASSTQEKLADAILNFLKKNPNGATESQIRKSVPGNQNVFREELLQFCERRLVTRSGTGTKGSAYVYRIST